MSQNEFKYKHFSPRSFSGVCGGGKYLVFSNGTVIQAMFHSIKLDSKLQKNPMQTLIFEQEEMKLYFRGR